MLAADTAAMTLNRVVRSTSENAGEPLGLLTRCDSVSPKSVW
jgi:hypothetical protein